MRMTADQFLKIMPFARNKVDTFLEPLNDAMEEFEIDVKLHAPYFLAQLAVESVSLSAMEEYGSGASYSARVDLGNTEQAAKEAAARAGAPSVGAFYKGHGPIQITGYYNHMLIGEKLGLDLVNEPRLLCTPQHGCRSAAAFWRDAPLRPTLSLVTVDPERREEVWRGFPRIDLNTLAEQGDAYGISGVINTGKVVPDTTVGHLADRLAITKSALAAVA